MNNLDKNRQTGRTTRIANYVVDQLLNIGKCITTDHTVFEYDNIVATHLHDGLISKVENMVKNLTYDTKIVSSKIIDIKIVDKTIKTIYFELKDKN